MTTNEMIKMAQEIDDVMRKYRLNGFTEKALNEEEDRLTDICESFNITDDSSDEEVKNSDRADEALEDFKWIRERLETIDYWLDELRGFF